MFCTTQVRSFLTMRRSGTLILAGAMLLGYGVGVQRCAAQVFPNAPQDGQTFSIGVVQIVVDPSFAFLFAPAPSYAYYYPGYAGPASGILTGPVMYDGNTVIGESASHVIPGSGSIAVGTPALYPAPAYRNVQAYSDYGYIPPPFVGTPAGYDEIFTQIKQMNLVGYVETNGSSCLDPRVPAKRPDGTGQGGGPQVTVKAGPGGLGIGATLPMNRRSIGIVQQTTGAGDFPARSFFDVFVEVTLPRVPFTASDTNFPLTGAVLYNDASNPLLIENLSITNLPPEATYVHGQSTAVPIRFRDNRPPFWAAGDVLGYLTLAGHGVFTNVVTATAPCAAATAPGGLLDLTLGPVGSPIPPPPVPWLRPTNTFPTPTASYDSVVNRIVDSGSGQTNVLDDTLTFPNGTITNRIRGLRLSKLGNSITPPAPNNSAPYSEPNMIAAFEFSEDGVSWGPGTANGALSATITCTSGPGDTTATFDTEMLSLDLFGIGPIGTVAIRESPTKQSLGKHTLRSDARGYRVSSFFDVFLELSTDDGITWIPASRPMRVLASLPPAVPGTIFSKQFGTKFVMQWQNGFTLQSTPSLDIPFTDVLPGPVTTGPYTNAISGDALFFRLRN
jgi:hypothetical protein